MTEHADPDSTGIGQVFLSYLLDIFFSVLVARLAVREAARAPVIPHSGVPATFWDGPKNKKSPRLLTRGVCPNPNDMRSTATIMCTWL